MDTEQLLSDKTRAMALDRLRQKYVGEIAGKEAVYAAAYAEILQLFIENEMDNMLHPNKQRDTATLKTKISYSIKAAENQKREIDDLRRRLDALKAIQEKPGNVISTVKAYVESEG